MALLITETSKEVNEIFLHRVYALMSANKEPEKSLLQQSPENASVTALYEVYIMPPRIPLGFKNAEQIGWQALILDDDRAIAMAEVHQAFEIGSSPAFARLSTGAVVQNTLQAISIASSMEQIKNADFEIRFLSIHELFVSFVWLHGKEDYFIPVLANHGLELFNIYSQEQLTEILTEPVNFLIANIEKGFLND